MFVLVFLLFTKISYLFSLKNVFFLTSVLLFVPTKCFICPNSNNVRNCSEYTNILEWLWIIEFRIHEILGIF